MQRGVAAQGGGLGSHRSDPSLGWSGGWHLRGLWAWNTMEAQEKIGGVVSRALLKTNHKQKVNKGQKHELLLRLVTVVRGRQNSWGRIAG